MADGDNTVDTTSPAQAGTLGTPGAAPQIGTIATATDGRRRQLTADRGWVDIAPVGAIDPSLTESRNFLDQTRRAGIAPPLAMKALQGDPQARAVLAQKGIQQYPNLGAGQAGKEAARLNPEVTGQYSSMREALSKEPIGDVATRFSGGFFQDPGAVRNLPEWFKYGIAGIKKDPMGVLGQEASGIYGALRHLPTTVEAIATPVIDDWEKNRPFAITGDILPVVANILTEKMVGFSAGKAMTGARMTGALLTGNTVDNLMSNGGLAVRDAFTSVYDNVAQKAAEGDASAAADLKVLDADPVFQQVTEVPESRLPNQVLGTKTGKLAAENEVKAQARNINNALLNQEGTEQLLEKLEPYTSSKFRANIRNWMKVVQPIKRMGAGPGGVSLLAPYRTRLAGSMILRSLGLSWYPALGATEASYLAYAGARRLIRFMRAVDHPFGSTGARLFEDEVNSRLAKLGTKSLTPTPPTVRPPGPKPPGQFNFPPTSLLKGPEGPTPGPIDMNPPPTPQEAAQVKNILDIMQEASPGQQRSLPKDWVDDIEDSAVHGGNTPASGPPQPKMTGSTIESFVERNPPATPKRGAWSEYSPKDVQELRSRMVRRRGAEAAEKAFAWADKHPLLARKLMRDFMGGN